LLASGSELARAIRTGQTTSVEVVTAHIERALVVADELNAIVQQRFDTALREARAADARVAASEPDLPPFHGVPCTIKESFEFEGMRLTSGLVARRDVVSQTDAPTVARLRAAGAIPIGTTNVSELLMWLESSNRVYGRTNNPYDSGRIAGGSSGGEGCIIGAGASPFGLGADIGGSIRLPAFFNGVFGHKPTGGLVPSTGQYPIAENAALRYLASGPLARRAADLMPLLRTLAGPDGVDPATMDVELGDPGSVDIAGLEVLVVRGNGHRRVHRDLLAAQQRAAEHLAGLGARVRDHTVDDLRLSFDIWSQMLSAASETPFRTLLGNGTDAPLGRHFLGAPFGLSPHTLPALMLAATEKMPMFVPSDTGPMVAIGRRLKAELAERLGDGAVMLYPPYTRPAPRHGMPMLTPFDFTYTGIFNALEMPATAVPMGFSKAGLPVGVQVVAAHFRDHIAIAVAMALESVGGWTPPWRAPARRRWFGTSTRGAG